MVRRCSSVSGVLALLVMMAGCAPAAAPEPEAAGPPLVVTTHPAARALLAGRVADDVEVMHVDLPSGVRPDRSNIRTFLDADLVVVVGGNVEPWVATAVLPRDRLFVITDELPTIQVDGPAHRHGTEGDHVHKERDGFFWLVPERIVDAAAALDTRLGELAAGTAPDLTDDCAALAARLDPLVGDITVTAPVRGFGSLLDRLGWTRATGEAPGEIELPGDLAGWRDEDSLLDPLRRALDHLQAR